MTTGFFTLPPELRLEVYGHLIKSCLDDGNIAGMQGLLFSCHKVFDELKTDCVPSVQPIIDVMHSWASENPDGAPLLVQLPKDYGFIKPPMHATISIPISSARKRSCYLSSSLQATLFPVLRLEWSSLTLRFHDDKGKTFSGMDALLIPHYFFYLIPSVSTDEHLGPLFSHTSRLILLLSDEGIAHKSLLMANGLINNMLHLLQGLKGVAPIVSWTTGKAQEPPVVRELGFDFEDGLPEVEGLNMKDGVWKNAVEEQ